MLTQPRKTPDSYILVYFNYPNIALNCQQLISIKIKKLYSFGQHYYTRSPTVLGQRRENIFLIYVWATHSYNIAEF